MAILLAGFVACALLTVVFIAITLHSQNPSDLARLRDSDSTGGVVGIPAPSNVRSVKTKAKLLQLSSWHEKNASSSKTLPNHFHLSFPNKQNSESDWSWPIIHIVSTRFMQGQGSLVSLAQSRLKLLEAICLPSIQHQTILDHDVLTSVYNSTKWGKDVMSLKQSARSGSKYNTGNNVDPLFLWVIKVDPNMDKQILNELKTVLEPVKQFTIVVGSLMNYGIGIHPGGWRDGAEGQDVLDAFQDGRVFFPKNAIFDSSYQLIRRAHEARSDRVVLETRLDADDAVHLDYIAALYEKALQLLVDRKVSKYIDTNDNDDENDEDENENDEINDETKSKKMAAKNQAQTARWLYWCPQRHVQWSPSSDFFNPNNDPGMLTLFESENMCITPGLTLGFAVGTDELDVPRYEHTKIYWEIAMNHNNKGNRNMKHGAEEDKHHCGLRPSSKCVAHIEDPKLSAFRSRAMTSAGMHNIEERGIPSVVMPKEYQKFSHKLWKSMEDAFGINPKKAKDAADFMMNNYVSTVRDNLRGQCTHGHSCKISSLEKLQRTIDIMEEEISGVEIHEAGV